MCRGFLKLINLPSKHFIHHQGQGKELAIILNGIHTFIIKEENIKGVQFFEQEFLGGELHVCFINQKLNVKAFDKIIKCLMGFQCSFDRNQQVINLIKITRFLKVHELQKILENDLTENFDDYGFFVVFEIAEHFNYCQLKLKCLKQLLTMEFEQINFNRYQLFERPKDVFEYVIKLHNYFQQKQMLIGLGAVKICQIIQQYCKFSSAIIRKDKLFQIDQQFKDRVWSVQSMYEDQFNQSWVRFRTPSFSLSQLSQSVSFGNTSSKNINSSSKLERYDTNCTTIQFENSEHTQNYKFDIEDTSSESYEADEELQERISQDFSSLSLNETSEPNQLNADLASQFQIRLRKLRLLFSKQR